jgi:hypothetical protein
MKPQSNFAIPLLFVLALAAASALASADRCRGGVCLPGPLSAQQGVSRGPASAARDPELEKQSLHNLEVARFYFKRKPDKSDKQASLERLNKAVESRLVEILDTYPNFSRIDEVYFLLGEVYHRGGQTEKAIEYLSKVVKELSDSPFYQDAKKRLEELQPKSEPKKEG